ncbi:uncharacterized protein RCC_08237 [Ramularia collo-cygni]|uniref:RRM domain-containing protein n=1 Tax=Ramularia collo-cygni TaxID=112498 RepID=A0A2D3V3I9_9PEZI|nr:uncharacterized protein RCC_08237 [Ramularia collo-cygni]CZT22368.1 uncharacterized protein RCC_08237 [Ramularia collo-cygni]
MNINALLSPDADDPSTGGNTESSGASPQESRVSRPGSKRTHSALSQEITRSPDRPGESPLENQSAQQQHHHYHHAQSTPTSYPISGSQLPSHGNPQRPVVPHRPISNSSVDATADLTRPQRQQSVRTHSGNSVLSARHSEVESHSGSPHRSPLHSRNSGGAPPILRGISRQSLADLTMAEAPSQTPPPRDFTSDALSDSDSRTINELLNFLREHSYAYSQHVQLIGLLHKGFLLHVDPAAEGLTAQPSAPQSYALLHELRQAREAMDTRFAVGEIIWAEWLSDEMLLASTSDERIAVTELCQRAVQDEPASTKLWIAFVDWVSSNYASCHNLENAINDNWTEEDKEICRDLFTKDMIVSILEQAVAATQWRIDESHLLWNRYAQIVQESLPSSPSSADAQKLHSMFLQRLQVPHIAWGETKQIYWPIVSRFEGDAYETVFEQVDQAAAPAKLAMGIREQSESKLMRAIQSRDNDAVHREMVKYLKSEKFRHNRKPGVFDFDLRCGLYERALLIEPTNTEWWLDYVDFVITAPTSVSQSVLPLIERATRHCPWSGDLWARRILRADVERRPRDEIESTKHRATNAGLLDVGGMDELVKMLQEWCSYLRRHAFRTSGAEDDLDTAEMGIGMALEDVQQAGVKIYGPDFLGDPLFRLEQIQIKFYTEARRFKDARNIYQQLATRHGHSYDLWHKYYVWELWLWGWDRVQEAKRVETDENGPDLASAVLQQALRQRNLDLPEQILQLYLDHFRQHESGTRLQVAIAEGREFANRLAADRAKETARVAAEKSQQYPNDIDETEDTQIATGEKRKRDETSAVRGEASKKIKTDPKKPGSEQPSAHALDNSKRDREHSTISVTNLPADVTEVDIKKFFRDCGNFVTIKILPPKDSGQPASATIEFETAEDVLAAQTRDGKEINGHVISIHSGAVNTLYVCNYPAEYEENAIRGLFDKYGEIVSVRFPSLKLNLRRRFCYVEFLTAEMAKNAETAMDGMKIDGLHTLVAKISDPNRKQARTGAQQEGRELFVKNFDKFKDSPEEIRKLLEQYGEIEKFNLIRTMNNQLLGNGFVAYKTAEAAAEAVKGLNDLPRNGRILHVSYSTPKGRTAAPIDRARVEDVIIKHENGSHRGSNVSMGSNTAPAGSSESTSGRAEDIKARKVAIFSLPDTVNDARIQAAMEKFGPITKIQIRRDKEGAIVEFNNLKTAFHVRQGVDVSELGPKVTTGDVGDLLKKEKKKPAFIPPAAARASQNRGGRRGGLGFKRGGGGGLGSVRNVNPPVEGSSVQGEKKSNSDFRTMLLESKKTESKTEAEE